MILDLTDNAGTVREALLTAKAQALDSLGRAWVQNARAAEGVFDRWGEELRRSIVHQVDGDTVAVGSDLDIAAYAELGTGPHYAPPPEWMENRVPKGMKVPSGAEHWVYRDPADGAYKIGAYQPPTPFLRPALENHIDEYRKIFQFNMKGDTQHEFDQGISD